MRGLLDRPWVGELGAVVREDDGEEPVEERGPTASSIQLNACVTEAESLRSLANASIRHVTVKWVVRRIGPPFFPSTVSV